MKPVNICPQRKRPVHKPPVERHNQPVILFVTLAVHPRGNFLASDRFHRVFPDACGDADAWSVGRYVIMPDHVHLFCVPGQWPIVSIKRWTTYLKERFTKRLAKELALGDGSAQPRPPGVETVPDGLLEGEPAVSRWNDEP